MHPFHRQLSTYSFSHPHVHNFSIPIWLVKYRSSIDSEKRYFSLRSLLPFLSLRFIVTEGVGVVLSASPSLLTKGEARERRKKASAIFSQGNTTLVKRATLPPSWRGGTLFEKIDQRRGKRVYYAQFDKRPVTLPPLLHIIVMIFGFYLLSWHL